jgi:saccharopine dehydrogenase-like NADP-dependent oxidoreductase
MDILDLTKHGTAEQIIEYARAKGEATYSDDPRSATAYELGVLQALVESLVANRDATREKSNG